MTPRQDLYGGMRRTALLTLLLFYVAGCSPSAPPSPTATSDSTAPGTQTDMQTDETTTEADRTTSTPATNVGLPRLLDLGAGKCIPCKMMAPILEELEQEYAGVFDVEFIDVWQHPEEAKKHGVETIPTQIFFDASGKEIFRHVGFFSKEEILATWKQAGVEFNEAKEPDDV
jgi:thioredoxin 1